MDENIAKTLVLTMLQGAGAWERVIPWRFNSVIVQGTKKPSQCPGPLQPKQDSAQGTWLPARPPICDQGQPHVRRHGHGVIAIHLGYCHCHSCLSRSNETVWLSQRDYFCLLVSTAQPKKILVGEPKVKIFFDLLVQSTNQKGVKGK